MDFGASGVITPVGERRILDYRGRSRRASWPLTTEAYEFWYMYTDATGAEYDLDVNDNGKWRSREGIYVGYDPVSSQLYFRDGSYWVMGAVSGGVEQDSGSKRQPPIPSDAIERPLALFPPN